MLLVKAPRRPFALAAAVAVGLAFSVAASSAATFTIQGGTSGFLLPSSYNPATNAGTAAQMAADGVAVGTSVTTFFSGTNSTQGLFIAPQNVQLTFEFMGKEAGDTDAALTFLSTLLFTNNASPGTTSPTMTFDVGSNPGLVPIKLTDQSVPATAINGGAIDPTTSLAFYIVPNTNSSVAYVFFDDGGAGPDRDYDDMVVRITAASITPVPAALPLFASGLGALGVLGWRRKRKLAA